MQSYLNGRLQAGDSAAKAQVIRMVLGAALTRAMCKELIQRNVARLATLPPAPRRAASRGRLTRPSAGGTAKSGPSPQVAAAG